jgi:hypothetical protein
MHFEFGFLWAKNSIEYISLPVFQMVPPLQRPELNILQKLQYLFKSLAAQRGSGMEVTLGGDLLLSFEQGHIMAG